MSNWNYRLMMHGSGDSSSIAVHEVYYDDDGNVDGWTENAVSVVIYADEGKDAINLVLERMAIAVTKPILSYETGKEIGENNESI